MSDENNQVVGEETFNTATIEVKDIPLVPSGRYPATFKGSSIHCGKEWNSVPNINLQHKLGEEGKNRVVFSRLNLNLHPDKNGQFHASKKNGLKAFLKVFDTDIEQLRVIKKTVTNPETGETVELKSLDAKQIQEHIQQFVNSPYEIRVTQKPAANGYPASNDVFEFFPPQS